MHHQAMLLAGIPHHFQEILSVGGALVNTAATYPTRCHVIHRTGERNTYRASHDAILTDKPNLSNV